MTQAKQIKSAALTPIEDIAAAWGVSTKSVQNWCEFTYQAFEIILPSSGPFPEWGVQLLTLAAKHVSVKASLYFSETGEPRRLKGAEYISKIRQLRKEGHFQEFQKFQSFQKSPDLAPADELEDELLAEVGQLTREGDRRFAQVKQAIALREEQQVDDLIDFVESSDHRILGKLTTRLKSSKALQRSEDHHRMDDAIEIAYQRID